MKTYLRALFLVAFTVFAVGSMMPAPATAASLPDDGMTAMAHFGMSECLDCSDRGEIGTAGCNLICAAGASSRFLNSRPLISDTLGASRSGRLPMSCSMT
ncbi:hypothetical protein F1642_13865 [Paracoccus sp. NBH48]|uniref:hypothetical protein n=1 Tax=Paracoccus sp. NBH48 TaxID=2596918 RepID=UPI0018918FC6|nr:hypothetical protein [Paracoccus sp. NBH48]MBF5080007.1 hypothetical protein [Paracoccus sp. NBH48]